MARISMSKHGAYGVNDPRDTVAGPQSTEGGCCRNIFRRLRIRGVETRLCDQVGNGCATFPFSASTVLWTGDCINSTLESAHTLQLGGAGFQIGRQIPLSSDRTRHPRFVRPFGTSRPFATDLHRQLGKLVKQGIACDPRLFNLWQQRRLYIVAYNRRSLLVLAIIQPHKLFR